LAVGANRDDNSGTNRGTVHILFLDKTVIVTDVTSTNANGLYTLGDTIDVIVTFSEPVTVTGIPQLILETGAVDREIDFSSGSGTDTLTFQYIVQAGDVSSDLAYVGTSSLTLNGGTIVATTSPSSNALLSLQVPDTLGSLSFNKDITIDTQAPSVTITSSSGVSGTTTNSNTLSYTATFDEPVTGFDVSDITVSGSASITAASNFVAISNIVYTFDVLRGSSDGTVSVLIAADVATDTATNDNEISNLYEFTIDTQAPTIISASFNEATGVLTLNFDESIDQDTITTDVNVSLFTITDANNASPVQLTGATVTTVDATTINITLTETQRGQAISHGTPDLDITLGAVHDISQNDIAASLDNSITISANDITPPQFSSATLNEGTGTLVINFNETIDQSPISDVVLASFAISDADNTDQISLDGATPSAFNSTAVSINLTETQRQVAISYGTPQLDIDDGAVRDTAQNDIAASPDNAITISAFDVIAPRSGDASQR